jgi:hypothetical protein
VALSPETISAVYKEAETRGIRPQVRIPFYRFNGVFLFVIVCTGYDLL